MNTIIIKHIKELPNDLQHGFLLRKDFTQDDAVQAYAKIYGRTPEVGRLYDGKFLYFDIPEGSRNERT